MASDLVMVAAVAGAAAAASPIGGLIALWRKPTSLFMSTAFGFASGVLLGTIAFEMLPRALELSSVGLAVAGFAAGFLAVYGFDLFIHRGFLAGEHAEQRPSVERFRRRRRPRGDEVTVLAGGTSVEELIEGLSIGVGATIDPGLGMLVGLAIVIDNLSEGLGIGELALSRRTGQRASQARRILGWTSLIGAALLGSALVGWGLLRGVPEAAIGVLLGLGGGGMFYLTITDLVPEGEERHYQQSAALATAAGFMIIFVLAQLF